MTRCLGIYRFLRGFPPWERLELLEVVMIDCWTLLVSDSRKLGMLEYGAVPSPDLREEASIKRYVEGPGEPGAYVEDRLRPELGGKTS